MKECDPIEPQRPQVMLRCYGSFFLSRPQSFRAGLLALSLFVLFGLAFTPAAKADFKGETALQRISFTEEERDAHLQHLDSILTTAIRAMEGKLSEHQAFYRKNGFSKFVGDRFWYDSPEHSDDNWQSVGRRTKFLQSRGLSTKEVSAMSNTSCVGFTMEVLQEGFLAPRDPALTSAWNKINIFVRSFKSDGAALIFALQKLDWKVYYWNPDTRRNRAWDASESGADRGWHQDRWVGVRDKSVYYVGNPVDDKQLLVNFGRSVPRQFRNFPFFVGIAHSGYHVFPGYKGKIIEAHTSFPPAPGISDKDFRRVIETSQFNPMQDGGGPRGNYRSGLIAVPPM